MTYPFERTPKGAEEQSLHLVAPAGTEAPLRRAMAATDETGVLAFSMLTLEAEDRS